MKTKSIAGLAAIALLVLGAVYLIASPGGNGNDAENGPSGISAADQALAHRATLAIAGQAKGAMENFVPEANPSPVPAVSFVDVDGKEHDFSLFRGKLVLLNLWATWCAPCRHEMPTLDQLQSEVGSDRVEVVALSVDQTGLEGVKKFFSDIKVSHLAIYNDPSAGAGLRFKAIGLPTTLLISPDGLILGRFVGPAEWNAPEARALIQAVADIYAGPKNGAN